MLNYRVGRQDAYSCSWVIVGAVCAVFAVAQNAFADALEWYPGEYVVEMNSQPGMMADIPSSLSGSPVIDNLGSGSVLIRRPIAADAPVGGVAAYNSGSDSFCAGLMNSNSQVRSCSPNYVMRASAVPNDSNYGSLWGLKGAYGIDAPAAWDLSTGSNDVIVAVIDTGVDYNHPDLAGNLWVNTGEIPGNGRDDDNNGYIDDVYGINAATGSGDPMDDNSHGTHVSGTIGGAGNNARGVVGVNWRVKVMGLKFLNAQGSGSLGDAIKAINYMVLMKSRGVNIRISNNSWGGGGYSDPLFRAIERAKDAGILFVAAAGNASNDNDANASYPASYDVSNVVSVAAIDQNGNLASFSNYGAQQVDIAAPGVDILSTVPGNRYASYSGTSMATPHVAGALALLLAYTPSLGNTELLERLYASGRDLASLAGVVRTGRTLNVNRMLRNETAPIAPVPVAPSCLYTMAQIQESPDTSADAGTVVLSGLDDAYTTISLPFTFPFHGQEVGALSISTNGVVYTRGAPSMIDYAPGTVAPKNSIAPLHTDLYPVGGANAVRVSYSANSVTINWTASTYLDRDGVVTLRMRISSSGAISEWMSFSSSSILQEVRSRAVIGIRGESTASAYTYSVNDSKISNGLALRFTPHCGGSQGISRIVESNLSGEDKRGKAINRVLPGGYMNLAALGAGTGSIKVAFKIDGKSCRTARSAAFVDGISVVRGRFPKIKAKKVQALATGEDGVTSSATIRVKLPRATSKSRTSSNKKLTARQVNNACQSLVGSLSEQM